MQIQSCTLGKHVVLSNGIVCTFNYIYFQMSVPKLQLEHNDD